MVLKQTAAIAILLLWLSVLQVLVEPAGLKRRCVTGCTLTSWKSRKMSPQQVQASLNKVKLPSSVIPVMITSLLKTQWWNTRRQSTLTTYPAGITLTVAVLQSSVGTDMTAQSSIALVALVLLLQVLLQTRVFGSPSPHSILQVNSTLWWKWWRHSNNKWPTWTTKS